MKKKTNQISNGVDQFNIVIVGTGGQGLITLLQIVAEAALRVGLDIRTSELHGLSQRGGSVEVHIRFGKKIYSPLIAQGKAGGSDFHCCAGDLRGSVPISLYVP